MGEQASNSFQIATAFGELSRRGAEDANRQKTQIAQANFDSGKNQITAQADERSRQLAAVFQRHVGTLRANAAFRGTGGEGPVTAEAAAGVEASIAKRNIEINAVNLIGNLASQSMVVLEDPVLAQIQGTIEGLSVGSQFAAALAAAPPKQGTITWGQVVPGQGTVMQTVQTFSPASFNFLEDFGDLFPDLGEFLGGQQ